MLSMRKIDTIRKYKFDLDMPIRTICYKLDVSPTTVYKYTNMDDFTELLRKPRKSRPSRMEPHKFIIKEWLLEDKTRHYKQRHTAKRDGKYYMELYDDIIIPDLGEVHYKRAITERNKWIVNKSDMLLCYVTRSSGGAYQMLQYAQKLSKSINKLTI